MLTPEIFLTATWSQVLEIAEILRREHGDQVMRNLDTSRETVRGVFALACVVSKAFTDKPTATEEDPIQLSLTWQEAVLLSRLANMGAQQFLERRQQIEAQSN